MPCIDAKFCSGNCLLCCSIGFEQGYLCLCTGIFHPKYATLIRNICGIEDVFLILVVPCKFHIPTFVWQNVAIQCLFLFYMVFAQRQTDRYCAVLIHRISCNIFAVFFKLCTFPGCNGSYQIALVIPVCPLVILRHNILRCSNLKDSAF